MAKIRKICVAVIILLVITIFSVSLAKYQENLQPVSGKDKKNSELSLMPDGIYDFPALYLSSELDPFNIDRELWHDATASIRGTTEPFLFENIAVRLRGRGNSSWVRGAEKRPLRIRFIEPRAFLDSGYKARDWVLIANLFDLSLMRNYAAFYLADLMDGMDWTPFSRLVHLYVNDEYWGVYQLADERDTDNGRLQLNYDPHPALCDYFFELDGAVTTWLNEKSSGNIENVDFFSVDEKAYEIHFPKSKKWNGHLEYLRDFVRNAKETARTRDYDAIAAVIDIDSFVDFYIMQELFKNIDVGNRSMFMQVKGQGSNRRLYFGPIWDFDRSSGNTLYWTDTSYVFASTRCSWCEELYATPEIYGLIVQRWNEIKNGPVNQMVDHIAYLSYNYREAFEKNFERHDNILGADPQPKWFEMLPEATRQIDTFEGQAAYFIDWLENRINWLDNYYNHNQ